MANLVKGLRSIRWPAKALTTTVADKDRFRSVRTRT